MPRLLIATHNPAKKEELGNGFRPLIPQGINLAFVDDAGISEDPEETGSTFLENARLKARYFSGLSRLPTVADDGGIEIDILNGEPGVHSKRWLGHEATDAEMIAYTLKKLEGYPAPKRTAKFTVCLYYSNPLTGFEKSVTESVAGHIALSPSAFARKGFPYRALFIVDRYQKFYDELEVTEHAAMNHRLRAVNDIIPFIIGDLIQ